MVDNFTLSALALPVLLILLVIFFISDLRRLNRGEGLKVWFKPDKVHPYDAEYPMAVRRYFAPYFIIFGIIALLAGMAIYGLLGGDYP